MSTAVEPKPTAELGSKVRAILSGRSAINAGATVVTIVIALLIAFVIVWLIGKDPISSFQALIMGPLERPGRIGRWLEETTTLAILGLSVAIPFRTGQISIGSEGQLYVGALAAGVIAIFMPGPGFVIMIVASIAAMVAGGAVGYIPGVMKARLGANEIVATLMLNFVILQLFDYLVQGPLKSEGNAAQMSDRIQPGTGWPRFSDLFSVPFGRANIGLFIAILLAIGVWFLLTRTPWGYRFRVVGSNPDFGEYGGMHVKSVIEWSFVLGGAIAGLAGAHLLLGVFGRLELGMAAGLAFLGIVVSLLARNSPLGILLAAAFYAYLRVGGDVMEQTADVGTEIVIIIQAVIVILVTARALPDLVARFSHRKANR